MGNKGVNPKCPQCGKQQLYMDLDIGLLFCKSCSWREKGGEHSLERETRLYHSVCRVVDLFNEERRHNNHEGKTTDRPCCAGPDDGSCEC